MQLVQLAIVKMKSEEVSAVFEFQDFVTSHNSNDLQYDDSDLYYVSLLDDIQLSDFQKNILYYISGNIAQKFLNEINCILCKEIILSKMYLIMITPIRNQLSP